VKENGWLMATFRERWRNFLEWLFSNIAAPFMGRPKCRELLALIAVRCTRS